MEENGDKNMKHFGVNSFPSRPSDQEGEGDERNNLPKSSSSLSTYSTVEDQDRQDLEIDIEKMINGARNPLSSDCCIYRVSPGLREVNRNAYTPRTVSIGPLHHRNKNLRATQEVKAKYLQHFLKRAIKTAKLNELPSWADPMAFLNSKDDIELKEGDAFSWLNKFIRVLESSEDKIRKSYADDLNHMRSNELLKIILVDSAFIIELFLRFYFDCQEDTIISTPIVLASIRMDLWLLENQVPFFVLKELYDEAFGFQHPDIYKPFLYLSCKFFENYNDQKVPIEGEIEHFTDLQRTFLLPIPKDEKSSNVGAHKENCSKRILKTFTDFLRCWGLFSSSAGTHVDQKEPSYFELESYSEQLKSATQLHAAGVVLNVSSSNCLLDISFSKPKLEIPCLHLYDDTEALFRNVMALEQHHYPTETLICDYVTLMDYLINTSEDVELLVEMKIIKNRLGSNQQVASLFNSLCRNILKGFINKRFKCFIEDLNAYYDKPWHSWKATFRRQYCSTPWKSASTIAASILLLLTLIQTILTAVAS